MTKERPSGAVSKVNDTMFYYIFTPGFVKVALLFIKHNFELRVCGGAVRYVLHLCATGLLGHLHKVQNDI